MAPSTRSTSRSSTARERASRAAAERKRNRLDGAARRVAQPARCEVGRSEVSTTPACALAPRGRRGRALADAQEALKSSRPRWSRPGTGVAGDRGSPCRGYHPGHHGASADRSPNPHGRHRGGSPGRAGGSHAAGRHPPGWLGVPDASSAYLLAVVGVAVGFGTRCRDRDRVRCVPRLRRPVHRAPAHAHRERPRRVAQPAAAARRGDRRRPARGPPARAGRTRRRRASARRARCSASATPLPRRPPWRRPRTGSWTILVRGRGMDRAWIRLEDDGARRRRHRGQPARRAPAGRPRTRRCCGGCPATSPRSGRASTSPDGRGRTVTGCSPTGCGSRTASVSWARSGACDGATCPPPTARETRLLSAAADQLAGALVRGRLAAAATDAEVAAAARPPRPRCSTPSRMTCARRWPRSGPPRLADGPRRGVGAGRGPPDGGRHRPRGRPPEPARLQPAGHEPHRCGRAAAAAGDRTCWPTSWSGPWSGWRRCSDRTD